MFAAYAGQDPAAAWGRFGERAASEFAVVADEPIDGLAERVAQLEGVDDEEAAARLEPGVSADGLPVGTERGLRDTLQRAVGRLRDRRLVEDLGEASSSFELLGLHVPTGGRAAIDLGQSAATERQLSFKLFGFGFGSGRSVEVEINEGIAERSSCMRVVQHVVVHVRRFEAETARSSRATSSAAARASSWPGRTARTAARDAEPDPFDFDLQTDEADALDLRGYDERSAGSTRCRLEGVRKTRSGSTCRSRPAAPRRPGSSSSSGRASPARSPTRSRPDAGSCPTGGPATPRRCRTGTRAEWDCSPSAIEQPAAGEIEPPDAVPLLAPLARGRAPQARATSSRPPTRR